MRKFLKLAPILILFILAGFGYLIVTELQKNQNPEDTSAASSNSGYAFNGTFISFGELDTKLTTSYLTELKSLNIDTVIIASTREKSSNCKEDKYKWVGNVQKNLDPFLQQADRFGIKVYVGLVSAEFINYNCYGNGWATGKYKTSVVKDYAYTLNYYKTKLKYFNSIDGWYIPDEPQLSWTLWTNVNIYYKEIVATIGKYSNKPVIISPYFIGAVNMSPDIIANNAKNLIVNTGIDILAVQDSIGSDCSLQYGKYSMKQYYQKISSKIGKNALWANNELFGCSYSGTNWQGGGYQPTSITRLVSQINMTSNSYVSGRVNWINQFHMTKVANNKMIGADRLFDSYIAYYGRANLKLLKPKSYKWSTKPSSKYLDSGTKEMFDGKLGRLDRIYDPGWTGIWGNAEITMDFGAKKNIRWLAFNTMTEKKSAISFPDKIQLYCSDDSKNWTNLGQWSKNIQIYGKNISEGNTTTEYMFGNSTPLNSNCRYIRAKLTNSDWTFISEIEIVSQN
jgi:hypothetical protein